MVESAQTEQEPRIKIGKRKDARRVFAIICCVYGRDRQTKEGGALIPPLIEGNQEANDETTAEWMSKINSGKT